MLQVFHMNVAKVDRDVAYIAMVVHGCCKLLFSMFYLFFRRMLQVCLSECCICFTHMLQVFYLMLNMFAMVSSVLGVFASVLDACFKCFIGLKTYVASVASGCFESRLSVASSSSPSICLALVSHPPPTPPTRSDMAV